MKDYVYRRTVAELQERSCELKRMDVYDEKIRSFRVYRIYTEHRENLTTIVSRYFTGFTVFSGIGYYEGVAESATVIEVVASRDALQTIVHLAGDIKHRNAQSSVLVTWSDVSRLDI